MYPWSVRLFATTLVFALLVPGFTASAAQNEPPPAEGTIVNTDGRGVHRRAEADQNAEQIVVLPEGAAVELAGEPEEDWQPVVCDGTQGFVHQDYIDVLPQLPEPSSAEEANATPASRSSDSWEPMGTGMVLGITSRGLPKDFDALDALSEQIGRPPAAVAWFQHWGNDAYWSNVQPELLEGMASKGVTPIITWDPWDPRLPAADPSQAQFAFSNILQGDFDAYIDSWAEGLAAFGEPVYVRFATEMNGNWQPWSVGQNGTTAEVYVDTWRYVHDRFSDAGVDNVRWVWNPNANWYDDPGMLSQLYPGDAYVDWVALDGFNWGTSYYWADCSCSSFWQTFADVFGSSYDEVASITDKPIMIAETASAEEGGDKAAWIRETIEEMPERFPQVRALIWFNLDKETDWRVESSPASLRAFVEVARSPEMQATLR